MNQKPILAILPGWGGSRASWGDFANRASEAFDVQIIELPCFGDEPCPKDVWGIVEYADFVKKKLESIEKEGRALVLLGHSFGGQVAIQLLSAYPNACDKLILSGAAIYRKKNHLKRAIFWPIAKCGTLLTRIPGLKNLAPTLRKVLYKAADSPDYDKTSGTQRDIFRKVIREDISSELPNIRQETCIVWGNKDTYTPLRFGKKIHTQIPNSRLVVIPGGTHGLHIKKQQELLRTITEFVTT